MQHNGFFIEAVRQRCVNPKIKEAGGNPAQERYCIGTDTNLFLSQVYPCAEQNSFRTQGNLYLER